MDKFKKIFSPGADKDDAVLYGDAETRRSEGVENAPEQETQKLHTTEDGQKKDHSILRQILNPGGEKHDDQRFGETATTQGPDPKSLQTNTEHKEHTITRQILNPGGDKYDEERFGTTAAAAGASKDSQAEPSRSEAPPVVGADTKLATDEPKKEHSILRQIVNPGGDNYDNQAFGTTAHAVSESERNAATAEPTTQKDHSITRQILNPGQEKYDPVVHGSAAQPTEQSLTDRTAQTSAANESNFGRNVAVGAGAGAAAIASTKREQADETTSGSRSTEPSYSATGVPASQEANDSHRAGDAAVVGGASAAGAGAGTYIASQDSSKITDRPHPLGGQDAGAHINPISAPEAPETTLPASNTATAAGASAGVHNSDYDGALGGATAAGVAGGVAASQLNQAPSDVRDATFTERAYPVGGPTSHHTVDPNSTGTVDIGHVPGEFPKEDGRDVHGLNPASEAAVSSGTGSAHTSAPTQSTALGAAAGAAGIAGVSSIDHGSTGQKPVEASTTQPSAKETPIHQSTAIGAVAGAPGLEGITSSVQHPVPTTSTQSDTQERPIQTTTNTLSSAPAEAQGQPHEHGREAAVAGGAGLAGAGAYAATQSGQSAGPASHTIGPHESNLANIADPKVKPDLEQQRGHETVGPHKTDLANKLDPRVDSDASKATGTYESTRSRTDTGPASNTVGPHESNIANIVDPKVKPDFDAQRGHETAGPHTTDLANKADLRVESDPAKIAAQRAAEQHAEDSAGGPNKLHKPRPDESAEEGEKKPSLIQRILHPGHKGESKDNRVAEDEHGHSKLHKKSAEVEPTEGREGAAQ